jgi:hypothetical protein
MIEIYLKELKSFRKISFSEFFHKEKIFILLPAR